MERLITSSMDETLLARLTGIVKANLGNEDFGSEELAKEAAISRSTLHRKLQDLVGKPASAFIRDIRLEESLKLLSTGLHTASEVAYLVGFSSPNYFSKCFHDQFGYPPSDVKKRPDKADIKGVADQGFGDPPFALEKGKEKSSRRTWGIFAAALILLTAIAWIVYRHWFPDTRSSSQNEITSIILAPLENISDEKNNYLAYSIPSEIANTLRNVPEMTLYAGMDVAQMASQNLTKKEIGDRLGVASILGGTIWKEDNRFRLSLFLTNIETDEILWTDSYDREYDSLMKVISEIAVDLSESIQGALTSVVREKINYQHTSSPEAYDLNMMAHEKVLEFYNTDWPWESIEESMDSLFNISNQLALKALEYDPNYVEPLALIASNEYVLGNTDTAKIMAEYLINRFPDSHHGYSLKAGIYLSSRIDLDKSLELYQMAYRLEPNDCWINLQLGKMYCDHKNDFVRGIPHLIKSGELPRRYGGHLDFHLIGRAYRSIGDYDKALYWHRRDLKYRPGCGWGVLVTYIRSGQEKQALNFLDSICGSSACVNCDPLYHHYYNTYDSLEKAAQYTNIGGGPYTKIWTAHRMIRSGNRTEAHKLLNEVKQFLESSPERKLRPWSSRFPNWQYDLALTYSLLGEKEKALKLLKEYENGGFRAGYHDQMMINPLFESLRDDPEFIGIYERVQKEKAEIRAKIRELEEKGTFYL